MAIVPVFHGTVGDDGKLILEALEKDRRRAYLQTLKGKPVDVVVKVHRNRRSDKQNAWLWGVAYPVIAEALGYDNDEHEMLHYGLWDLCFGTKLDQRLGREVSNVPRSSLSDTETFSKYMEWLPRWGAQQTPAIYIPLPGEAESTV